MFNFLKFVKAYLTFVKFLLVTTVVLTFSALRVESQHEYDCNFNGRVASEVHIYESKTVELLA